jgi:peptidoglycan/xylan/chitin deacetylase (PgdA/CDA1 family)
LLRIPILIYHDVAQAARPGLERWTVTPELFRAHIEAIAALGRRALTISQVADLLRGDLRVNDDVVAVTFDDGYASTRDCMLELLEHGISSTAYITTGRIGSDGWLSKADLAGLVEMDGIELGAHSVSHPRLDELPGAELEDEIVGSKRELEAVVGNPVASFSYPHGMYDRRARGAVMRAGYRSAVAVKNAISHLEDDPFALARWTVTADIEPQRLAQVVDGTRIPLAWRHERLRTRASRVARRGWRRLRGR